MKVSKFGGTSVANAEQIKKVAAIVKADPTRKFVVVSAPGKRFDADKKVTDLLIELANAAIHKENVEEKLQNVVDRYREIAEGLGLDQTIGDVIEKDLRTRTLENKSNVELFIDNIKASGEDNNAKLISAYFTSIGMPAQYINPKTAGLVVNDLPERAQALPEAYDNLSTLRNSSEIIVFPGFFGYTKDGVLRTFERGGSDITGSIVAAAVQAELIRKLYRCRLCFLCEP